MSSSSVALRARDVGKSYVIRHRGEQSTTLSEAALGAFRRRPVGQSRETFWALKDVSFEIQHGSVVGIVGRNGAGKSTLLKIISRITNPATGRIDVFGRVGSL